MATVAFSPDGTTLAARSAAGAVKLFDFPRAVEPDMQGQSVTFSKDGTTLLSSSRTGPSKLWDIATGEVLRQLEFPTELDRDKSFSADFAKVAMVTSDNTVKLWDLETNEHRSLPQQNMRGAKRLLLSPDGNTLALASKSRVQLWDMESFTLVSTLDDYQTPSGDQTIAFSPDGERLITACEDESLQVFSTKLWDRKGKLISTFSGHDSPVLAVACAADGSLLASGSWGDIKLWDTRSGRLMRTLKGYTDAVTALAFLPDRTRLVSGGVDGVVKLWDVSTGDEIIALDGHRSTVSGLTISPNSRMIASAHWDGTIHLWRAASAEEVQVDRSLP